PLAVGRKSYDRNHPGMAQLSETLHALRHSHVLLRLPSRTSPARKSRRTEQNRLYFVDHIRYTSRDRLLKSPPVGRADDDLADGGSGNARASVHRPVSCWP